MSLYPLMHLQDFLFAFKMHQPDHLKLSEKFLKTKKFLKKKKNKKRERNWPEGTSFP